MYLCVILGEIDIISSTLHVKSIFHRTFLSGVSRFITQSSFSLNCLHWFWFLLEHDPRLEKVQVLVQSFDIFWKFSYDHLILFSVSNIKSHVRQSFRSAISSSLGGVDRILTQLSLMVQLKSLE